MDFLTRKTAAGKWFARFIGPDGKQRSCSTKEVDKRRAQKIADRYEVAAHMARIGGLAAQQARRVIGEIYEIANREALPSDTVADYFHRWAEGLPITHGQHRCDPFNSAKPWLTGSWLTLFSADKRDRYFRVIKFWMDETLSTSFGLGGGVPSYQVEDEEGRIHLLLHLPIEEENEERWCLWRPDQAGFDFSVLSHE